MSKTNSFYDTVDQIVTYGVQKGILHLHNEDDRFSGNELVIAGRKVVNFGSCSYLGLEFDVRLKQGAIEAIDQYGTQFSESRAYVSLKPYVELERLLEKLFDAHCVVTPTTTLGHIANIPVLVKDDDVIIMDHQLHNSVQTAVSLVKARGVETEVIRHNRMDILEERIRSLRSKYRKIWYMTDGIYSMYGDQAPVDDIYALMDRYPELYYYVDDAHGISIMGKLGRGSVLNGRAMHPKMILAASLNKPFASGGGVMVYPDAEWARRVRTCGSPLLSSGPMQPSGLGAAVAAAKIHLSPEIETMQEELRDRIRFTNLMLNKYGLPIVSQSEASIFFVGVSLPKLGHNMIRRMLLNGYYLNLGVFPTVPMKNTGVRFTITRLHTFRQIEEMVTTMARELSLALQEENMTMEPIYKAFRMPMPEERRWEASVHQVISQSIQLRMEHKKCIDEIDQSEWDAIFEGKGNFDHAGLKTLEASFNGNDRPEDNWIFDYLVLRDNAAKIVAATFVTTAIWKDDMLSPAGVSRQVEEVRTLHPYYLTSKVVCCGSLLSEGEHLFVDRTTGLWKEAMQMILEKLGLLQEQYQANQIVIRDFHSIDESFDQLMVDNSFFRFSMGESYMIDPVCSTGPSDYYGSLSKRSKGHVRSTMLRYEKEFAAEVQDAATPAQIKHWYQLYQNVKEHSLELNTFDLPEKFFTQVLYNKKWEVLILKLKKAGNEPVCMVLCYRSGDAYIPMIIGLDYTFNKAYNIYRQALYQIVLRAMRLRKKKILLGFGAATEKKKLGAKPTVVHAYIHSKDIYNQQVLSNLK